MKMKLVLATSLLWAINDYSSGIVLAAAFNANVRPVVSLRCRSSVMASRATETSHRNCRLHHDVIVPLSMTNGNEYEIQHNLDNIDSRGRIQILSVFETANDVSRRSALAQLAAVTATFLGVLPAKAGDDAPTTAFSESPTSEASIARLGYEEKIVTTAEKIPTASSTPEERDTTASLSAEAPTISNGPPTATDTPRSPAVPTKDVFDDRSRPLEPKIVLPLTGDLSPDFAIATAAFVGLAVIANNIQEDSDLGATASAPAALPYGLSAGQNNPVDENANEVKQAEAVVVTPLPPPPQPEKKKWQAEKPIPYGIQNPNGKNPFLKEILDYCEGGKVTERCTETIKVYLDNLADSGAVATSNEVKAIVGYLDSLGSNSSATGEKKKVGAAFTSYLDALSAGSAPPPSSAQAVKTYLDTLNGTVPTRKLVNSNKSTPEAVEPLPAAPTASTPDFAQYNNRLTSIEGRVTSLELKVDKLPDQVFEKIEAWQTKYESRMSEEVKKIVRAMQGPPLEPVVIAPEPPSLEPALREVPNVNTVAAQSPTPRVTGGDQEWTSAIVDYPPPSPLPAIPERPVVPRAGSSSSSVPKKYGFSGGSQGWKTGKPKSGGGGYLDNISAEESSSPAPTPANPSAFPRSSSPAPAPASGPKKYGISGGSQGWKTSKPKRNGGGYLDNMSP